MYHCTMVDKVMWKADLTGKQMAVCSKPCSQTPRNQAVVATTIRHESTRTRCLIHALLSLSPSQTCVREQRYC